MLVFKYWFKMKLLSRLHNYVVHLDSLITWYSTISINYQAEVFFRGLNANFKIKFYIFLNFPSREESNNLRVKKNKPKNNEILYKIIKKKLSFWESSYIYLIIVIIMVDFEMRWNKKVSLKIQRCSDIYITLDSVLDLTKLGDGGWRQGQGINHGY